MRCDGCPFKDRPTCGSDGPTKAKVALIGRNPGREEAQVGRPFVGPSGQLLDAALEQIGLHRKDIWVGNVVNCHMEDDEAPTTAAYDACHDRLVAELKEVDPEIILTLGGEATSALGIAGKITQLVGSMNFSDELGKWILPTYHPAYILRGTINAFDDLSSCLDRARRLSTGETPFPEPLPYEHVHYVSDYLEAKKVLNKLLDSTHELWALDTETDYVRDPNWSILLVQVSDGVDAWVFEADALMIGEVPGMFRHLLTQPSKRWVFHNSAFDLQQLWHHWRVKPTHIEDTMAMALCLTEKLDGVGLKKLVNSYLSVPHYETEIHKYLKSKVTPFSAIPRHLLVQYAGFDAIYTQRLHPVLKRLVEQEGNWHLYEQLLNPAQQAFAQMSYQGVTVDTAYIQALRDQYYPVRDGLENEMIAYASDKGFDARMVVKSPKKPDLNVRSPKQLIYFANNLLGLRTTTSDQSFIEKYEHQNEFVEMLKRFRMVNHMLDTYTDGIAQEVWPDGKVHPDFMLAAVTGRLSIRNPALQTLPNKWVGGEDFGNIRNLFIASPGYKYVHADYRQLEIHVAAYVSGDQLMWDAVGSGDFHWATAQSIFKVKPGDVIDPTEKKHMRHIAKLVVFGLMYGRQAWSLTEDMDCSVAQAQAYIDAFFTRYKTYAEWWNDTKVKALDVGELTTRFGRKRRWKLITSNMENDIRNQAVNFPIQSTASDIALSSLIKLNRILTEQDYGRVLFTVHDSEEYEIREECLHDAIPLIRQVMEYPFMEGDVYQTADPGPHFPVDIEVGRSMGELEEWHE